MIAMWVGSALVLGLMVGAVAGFVLRRRSDSWCCDCGATIGYCCADCLRRRRSQSSPRHQLIDMADQPI